MIEFHALGSVDLRASDGCEVRAITAQPKRLALLAYLVLAHPHGYHRRDTLVALFWPELDDAQGRAALSRVVYQLRSALGAEAILSRGVDEIAANFALIRCDAVLMQSLASSREWRQAFDLFRGDLLAGLYATGTAPEFDQWLEGRRAHFRGLAAQAAWRLVQQCEAEERIDDAIAYARRYLALRPGEETPLRNVMQFLDRVGDKSAAAALYREFAARMGREFELQPSEQTVQLLERMRQRTTSSGATPIIASDTPASGSPPLPRVRRRSAAYAVASAAAVVAIAVLALARVMASPHVPAIAVGEIRSSIGGDSASGFATLLNVNLARIDELDVISDARMREVAVAHTGKAILEVGRLAGAEELVDGILSRQPDGVMRLDLRRINIASGRAVQSHAIEARNLFDLADLATERIAADFGLQAVALRAEASGRSLIAYRLYDQGLRAAAAADRASAARLFKAALVEDSAFALAAFWLRNVVDGPQIGRYRQLAWRLAERANDRDRLFIRSHAGFAMRDPRVHLWADTFSRRYPRDPDTQLLIAHLAIADGRWRDAIMPLHRVIELDSFNARNAARCRACEAIATLGTVYTYSDSLHKAERLVLRWLNWQPTSSAAWLQLSGIHDRMERYRAGRIAIDSAVRYAADPFVRSNALSSHFFRTAAFDSIAGLIREVAASPKPEAAPGAKWGEVILYGTTGRARAAVAAARDYRQLAGPSQNRRGNLTDALLEATALSTLGQHRRAAVLWDSIAAAENDPISRAWWLLHAAGDYAAAGDTSELAGLEHTVREASASSLYVRHRVMHHYVRGLRHAAQNRHKEAASAFRRAMSVPEGNYVRIHRELGRALINAGYYDEAIETLRYGLYGPVSAAGLYATRTELQELLGQAYDRNNQRDSAIITYRAVLHAWEKADPQFAGRKARIESRIAELSRSRRMER